MGTIVTIIPADGWRAHYVADGHGWSAPLVCWALFEDGTVAGMVPEGFGATAAESDQFVEYRREEKGR